MMTESPVAASPRKPRRSGAKSTRTQQGEKSTKTAVYLSPDSMKRLGVTALMEGRTQSDIVDQLIREHLRRYVVQIRDRAASGDCDDQATPMESATAA